MANNDKTTNEPKELREQIDKTSEMTLASSQWCVHCIEPSRAANSLLWQFFSNASDSVTFEMDQERKGMSLMPWTKSYFNSHDSATAQVMRGLFDDERCLLCLLHLHGQFFFFLCRHNFQRQASAFLWSITVIVSKGNRLESSPTLSTRAAGRASTAEACRERRGCRSANQFDMLHIFLSF